MLLHRKDLMNSTLCLALAALPSLATLAMPMNTSASSFALRSFTVDGGGGRGIAGTYSLVATIGQPEASPALDAPPYVVTGGFLPPVSHAPTPAAPRLQALPYPDGRLRISWMKPAPGYVLEQTPSLPGTAGAAAAATVLWSPVSQPPRTNAAEIFVTVPLGQGERFYRLRRSTP